MNRMKELREERGLSMKEVAQRLGMPYTTYVNYEKSLREPNSETLIKIAAFFHVSVDYLLGYVSEPDFYLDNQRIVDEINRFGEDPSPSGLWKQFKNKEKSSSSAETDDELTQRLAFELYEMLIQMGWCKPGEDITDQQRDILLAVIDILDATFRQT